MIIKKNYCVQKKEKSLKIFIIDIRVDEIEDANNKIDYNNLKYVVASSGDEYRFNKIEDPTTFFDKI